MAVKRTRNRRLPRRLDKFFWDVSPRQIHLERHCEYVIARVLEHGDLVAIRWLIKTYRKEDIVNVVKSSRQLSRKTANFWRLRLGIPPSAVYALKRTYSISPEPFY